MSDNTAQLAGYTKALMVSYRDQELFIWVKPEADLDGRFKAYDRDECEWIWVNGWLIESMEEETA